MSTCGYHSDPLIDRAIDYAHATHPYYASAIAELRIVADPNVPTMATSAKWVTHYNPATVAGWTVRETAAVLVHEVEHLLRDHHGRCGDRDPGQWNIAGDAEINQRLSGLPDGAVYPSTLGMPNGQPAEVMYAATGSGKSDPQDGGPGDGGAPGKCGSSAGGPIQPHEIGDKPAPGADPDVEADTRRDVARRILAGSDAGEDMREWAEREIGIDRNAWYGALASAVGAVMAPYGAPTRWQWPGRRDPRDMGGAMVPRWTGNRPSCAVIIDTSSSVEAFDLELARAAGHFIGRLADARYYGCSTYVTDYGKSLPETILGGGGTDLRVGIARAIADGARAVVIITDCGTQWPTEPTSVPIIIGANPAAAPILDGPPSMYRPPEWMTVLPIIAAE